jgi:hypothetical protein
MQNNFERNYMEYPIWNDVNAPDYKGQKSYGSRNYTQTTVLVGSSSKNSFNFLSHETTVSIDENGNRLFQFILDGKLVKEGYLEKGSHELKILTNKI